MDNIQQLRRDLAPYFPSFEGTRDLGRGTAFPLTADVPGGLQTADRFFRSDLLLACVYDGARWLTQADYGVTVCELINFGTASPQSSTLRIFRADYAPAVSHVALHTRVSATNDALNYWTVSLQTLNAALAAADTIYSFTTPADGTSYVRRDAGPTLSLPTNRHAVRVLISKTGAPGAIEVAAEMNYRLIIT
jgi:hypothetical protein